MTEENKVSVILTSYNHAQYLEKAIESVLQQTYSDFDFIIWDDGSTDESWEIIKSYSDPRIRPFRNETMVRGEPLRRAVLELKPGKYIAVQHSDDLWELQKLEKQVTFLDENPQIGAVFTDVVVIGENHEPLGANQHIYQTVFNPTNRSRHEWLNQFFYRGNALCHPSILIRRECYSSCGLYRFGMAQLPDFDMWVRLCMKYEIHVLQEKLVRLRVRSNDRNSSGDRPDVRIRGWFEYLQVLDNYKSLTRSDELIKVFPSMEKYVKTDGYDPGFILGMAALEPNTYNVTKLFGLGLIFEALNEPIRAEKIRNLYNFSSAEFVQLTGQYDLFSNELKRNVPMLEAQVAEKDQQLHEIYNSRAWKLILNYRKIRSKFLHTNQTRKTT